MTVASTPSSFRYFIYSAVVTALATIAIYLRPSAGPEGVRWETQILAAIVTWVLLSSFIGGLGAGDRGFKSRPNRIRLSASSID